MKAAYATEPRMRRTVIVGAHGQDGRLLLDRRTRDNALWGQNAIETIHCVSRPPHGVDLRSAEDVHRLVEEFAPDEIYYLAAHHHSSEEEPEPLMALRECTTVHLLGLANMLEAIRTRAPRCRLFYAGSSQMFGEPHGAYQNESTPFAPRNTYAITKVAGANLCMTYRERHGVHTSVGILYNHESPLRGHRFVSQRIAHGAWRAVHDRGHRLKLGSLSTVVDWGYAPDFVDAMVRILSLPEPDDFVVATGQAHTVGDFVRTAFEHLGLDWMAHVEEDPALLPRRSATLVGDASKLRERTGWRPTLAFESMVRLLVSAAATSRSGAFTRRDDPWRPPT